MAALSRPRTAAALLWMGFLAELGCGTQGDASVLPDLWPRPGLSGYVFANPDAPELFEQSGWDLDEPAAAPEPASGGILVWGRMAPGRSPQASQLFSARVPSLDSPGKLEPALSPSLPWEGQGLRSPSVASPELPLLFYQGEDGSVGVADRDGESLKKRPLAAPLASAARLGGGRRVGRIGAALEPDQTGGRLRLYYTLDDSEVYVAEASVAQVMSAGLAQASAGVDWQVHPLGLTASDFKVPPGDPKAVPAEHIAELSVRRVVTPAGRVRWDLFLQARTSSDSALVVASAYAQKIGGERFAQVLAPLLATQGSTLHSPIVTSLRSRPLLLVGLEEVRTSIAAAVLP